MEKEVALKTNKKERGMLKYRPMFDRIITTANRKRISDGGIILTDSINGKTGRLLTSQVVLRAGENTPDYIKEGTVIELDMSTFPKKLIKTAAHDVGPDTYEVQPPLYEDDEGSEFMIMSVRNILYIIDQD